jgi:hypothetical protein
MSIDHKIKVINKNVPPNTITSAVAAIKNSS